MASNSPSITITVGEMAEYMEFAIGAGRVPCFWGNPGIGKTAVVEQFARNTGRRTFIFVGSSREPTEVIMEMVVGPDGKVTFKKPDWRTVTELAMLFIDEANRSSTMMSNALLRVINEHMVGDEPLPPTLAIAMACNYESDGGGINKTTSASGSRVFHLDVVSDLDAWCDWAFENGVAPVVIGYVRFMRAHFHMFNTIERTFPCPRTWHMLSDLYKQLPRRSMLPATAAGCVGQEAGVGFCAYESLYVKMQAHSVDAIVLNPTTYPVPTNVNEMYAIAAALADAMTPANADNIIAYLERMRDEYNVYAVKMATARKQELRNTASFTRWFVKNQGKF